MYALIDTCVLMDIIFQRPKLCESSKETIKKLIESKSKIFISPTTLKDIFYFAYKETHSVEVSHDIINRIYSMPCKIIDITADDAIEAIYDDGDFEDNILIQASKRSMLDCIITRNVKDFSNKDFLVLTPDEFNKHYKFSETK